MDPCYLLFILLLIKLSGTQDVTTVSKISVRRGQSILIPCLYKHSNDFLAGQCNHHPELSDLRYNPKTDDEAHKIFTVRMDNVQKSCECWCSVQRFALEVTSGPPMLYVSSQTWIGFENDYVSVTCYHQRNSSVRWCKFGGRCISNSAETLDGASVEIRYFHTHTTVTMNKLKMKNTGWYLCSTSNFQIPVHITVIQQMSPTSTELPKTTRKRTAVMLPVLLGIVLVIISSAAWRYICRERCLKSWKQKAEDTHYVIMHRKRSSHSQQTNYADVNEGTYERMAGLKSNIEEPEYVNVTKT